MSRLRYCALLVVLWAAMYLPGLGSTELKNEEGRRILPAMTMLHTGQWLIPYLGGKPFHRKPPLVNWAIAASFKLTGMRNEWTARLPSTLCVLALGLVIVATSRAAHSASGLERPWLSPASGFVAAIMAMTFVGLLAKARFAGAEIEGIYAPLSEMAMVCWLAWRARGCSPWLFWCVPGALLGLASLAKGPSLHLVFFYVVVIAVVWQDARASHSPLATVTRHLLHPAHLAGLALFVGIFALWAVPYFRAPEAAAAVAVWKREGLDRFTDSDFNAGNYFLNFPRALSDLLPWLVCAPVLIGAVRRGEARVHPSLLAALAAATGCSVVVLLIPGTLPRYVLPLGAPFALAFAAVVEGRATVIGRWFTVNRVLAVIVLVGAVAAPIVAGYPIAKGAAFDLRQAVIAGLAASPAIAICAFVLARRAVGLTAAWAAGASAALFGAGMFLYAGAAVRWIALGDDLRPLAAQIDAAVPSGATLTLYDPGYQAWIFYLRSRHDYAPSVEDLPPDVRAVLARDGKRVRRRFAEDRPDLTVAQTFKSTSGTEYVLFVPAR